MGVCSILGISVNNITVFLFGECISYPSIVDNTHASRHQYQTMVQILENGT